MRPKMLKSQHALREKNGACEPRCSNRMLCGRKTALANQGAQSAACPAGQTRHADGDSILIVSTIGRPAQSCYVIHFDLCDVCRAKQSKADGMAEQSVAKSIQATHSIAYKICKSDRGQAKSIKAISKHSEA